MKHVRFLSCIMLLTPLISPTTSCQELWTQAENYFNNGDFSSAYALYQELCSLYPHNADLACNTALCLQKLGRLNEAQSTYEAILATNPTHGIALRGASHVYLTLGNYEKGWPAYEYRWKTPPEFNRQLKTYLCNGGTLHGKRVHICTEYGLGDTLQFIRYVQKLKEYGATTIVECQKSLIPLMRLCPYIDSVIPAGYELPYDFRVMLMSLPWIFDITEETIPRVIPYLRPDPTLTAYWRTHMPATTQNIGICWQTNIDTTSPHPLVLYSAKTRSIAYELLKPLTQLPDVTLFWLQKITTHEERTLLTSLGIRTGDEHFDKDHGAFMDSAALIANLDLIITIDTATAHLAGGLGKPVWLLLPYAPDWRWMRDRPDTPWYPTMRLFRQPQQNNWHDVINEVIEELKKEISTKKGKPHA